MLPVNYVPRLEFDEVKTALEIAEESYRHAVDDTHGSLQANDCRASPD